LDEKPTGDEKMKISDHAKGHWPEIINASLGSQFTDRGSHQKCPRDGSGTDRYRFSDYHGNGNYFCACSEGKKDGFDLIQCVKGCSFADAVKIVEDVIGPCPKDEKPAEKKETWAERLRSETIKSNKSNYLSGRKLEVPPGVEFHKNLPYYKDGQLVTSYPAMLAPIVKNGRFLTYHVTYITPDGKHRKVLPANGNIKGGQIELYPASGEVLGVAEGIETAIAAKMLYGVPVFSLINTSIMTSWDAPRYIKKVIIFGDWDANHAGHAAAYSLSHKLRKKGISTDILFPDAPGDFNDQICEQSR
jgi:putative DNA primase/helicase